MQFLQIQMTMTHQFSGQHQQGDFVAVTRAGGGIGIDIDDVDAQTCRFWHRSEFAEHFLAEAAPGT